MENMHSDVRLKEVYYRQKHMACDVGYLHPEKLLLL